MVSISLVIPCYRSAQTLNALAHQTLLALQTSRQRLKGRALEFELILVDDGSDDTTWNVIQELVGRHKEIRGIRLPRNCGEHAALWEGYSNARGDFIFSMDDDLQHDPQDLLVLLEKLESGCDLVYGQYRSRQHSALRNIASRWNGLIASVLLGRPIGLHLSSFRAFSRTLLLRANDLKFPPKYVDSPLLTQARSVAGVPIEHRKSILPESRYNWASLLRLHAHVVLSGMKEHSVNRSKPRATDTTR